VAGWLSSGHATWFTQMPNTHSERGPAAIVPPPSVTAGYGREPVVYKAAAGVALRADVIGAEPGASKPGLMWIHGGGLIFGSRTISPRPGFVRALLERGFVLVSIDHRLAPETQLPAIAEDVADAWRWLHREGRERFGIATERLAIAGASAGAYLALLTAGTVAPRPRAVAAFWGFSDITAAWEAEPSAHYRTMDLVTREQAVAALGAEAGLKASADAAEPEGVDRSLFYLYCRQQGRWLAEVTGHDPQQDSAWFVPYLPARHIDAQFPPTVLLHGSADTDVPHAESVALARRLAECAVVHRFLSLDGVGHGFAGATPGAVDAAEAEVADFLAAQLR
jgi:acetyl esterase/lipase